MEPNVDCARAGDDRHVSSKSAHTASASVDLIYPPKQDFNFGFLAAFDSTPSRLFSAAFWTMASYPVGAASDPMCGRRSSPDSRLLREIPRLRDISAGTRL